MPSGFKRAQELIRKPVLFLVATGTEHEVIASAPKHEKGLAEEILLKHRRTAINLMLEAQKKGFKIVLSVRKKQFLHEAAEAGVRTNELLFLGNSLGFYRTLDKNRIWPSVVVVGGHGRAESVNDALELMLDDRKNRAGLQGKKPQFFYLAGSGIVSSPRSLNLRFNFPSSLDSEFYKTDDLKRLHRFGIEPITIHQFRAISPQGELPLRLQRLYFKPDLERQRENIWASRNRWLKKADRIRAWNTLVNVGVLKTKGTHTLSEKHNLIVLSRNPRYAFARKSIRSALGLGKRRLQRPNR
ncbi:hypothetical protein HY546_01640 [archaeon]|nr:hypothetical protein [archaeon]